MKGLILLFITVLSPSLPLAQVKPAHPEMLVSTDWLAAHLKDNNLVLIEIGPEQSDYDAGHIPAARFLPTDKIAVVRDGIRNELPPVDQLVSTLESLGITDQSRIVIYPSQYPTVATRLYWTLDYLGLADHASLLNGGIEQWKLEGKPLATSTQESTSSPKRAPNSKRTLHPKLNPSVLASLSEVQAAHKKGIVLLDSRPPEAYLTGHIADALPLYWGQTVAPGELSKFLDADTIARVYDGTGIQRGQKIITYCHTGMQATHSYFTLKYLGYKNLKMYDGSINEWSEMKHLPVASGDNP